MADWNAEEAWEALARAAALAHERLYEGSGWVTVRREDAVEALTHAHATGKREGAEGMRGAASWMCETLSRRLDDEARLQDEDGNLVEGMSTRCAAGVVGGLANRIKALPLEDTDE